MEALTIKYGVDEDGTHWGYLDKEICNTHVLSQHETMEGLIANIRMLMEDFQEHEWKEDKYWSKVNINEIEFNLIEEKEETTN